MGDGEGAGQGATEARRDTRTAICQAVCELLAKVGYDRMTMDAIAVQAKASKASIYRLWDDKPQLVAEALHNQFGSEVDTPDTGSLRGDLIALMTATCEITDSEVGEIIIGVMTAASHDPHLAETLNQTLFTDKARLHADILRRAAERGEIRPDTEASIVHETIHSMITGRKLWNLGPLDDEFVRHVVDDLLMPSLTR